MPSRMLGSGLLQRAGGGVTPASVAGLAFWQEASSLAVVADGTAVTAWPELTGKADTTTPGAAGTRPTYRNNAFGSLPAVRFDGTDDYMETASFALSQPYTVVMALRPRRDGPGDWRYLDGNTVNQLVLNARSQIYAGSAFVASNIQPRPFLPNIYTIVLNGASSVLYVNGIAQAAAATPGSNNLIDGFTYGAAGNQAGGFFAAMDLYGGAAYSGALSAANRAIVENYFAAKTGAELDRAAPASRIVFDGDSLTTGVGMTNGGSYPTQLLSLLGYASYSPRNYGVSGQTLAQMESDAATEIDTQFDATRTKNILVVWGGTNDIVLGADATTTYNRLVTYCTNRRAAGWKVVVCNIIARGNFNGTMNTYKDTVNASIASDWATFADGYADLAARSELSNASNTTYYSADTIHLKDAGYAIVAAVIQPVVLALP